MIGHVTVKFSCKCGIKDHPVQVRSRKKDEDLKKWMHEMGVAIGLAHRLLSRDCQIQTMEYVMMPVTQNGIGFEGPELTEEDKKELAEQVRKSKENK